MICELVYAIFSPRRESRLNWSQRSNPTVDHRAESYRILSFHCASAFQANAPNSGNLERLYLSRQTRLDFPRTPVFLGVPNGCRLEHLNPCLLHHLNRESRLSETHTLFGIDMPPPT